MFFNKLKQIIEFKIKNLKSINQSGLELENLTSNDGETDLNAKYELINTYINDLVFKKFNT